jgi:hypothetical protein
MPESRSGTGQPPTWPVCGIHGVSLSLRMVPRGNGPAAPRQFCELCEAADFGRTGDTDAR